MTALFSATTACFLFLFVIFAPLERLFPVTSNHRNGLARSTLIDIALFFLSSFVFASLIAPALLIARGALKDAPVAPVRLWIEGQHPIAQGFLLLVVGDLCAYWYHRFCHSAGLLWKFHRLHHSSHSLDWITATRQHPIDEALLIVLFNLPAVVLGVSFQSVGFVALLLKLHSTLIHSNIRCSFGLLDYVLVSPKIHHAHHRYSAERKSSNFSQLFSVFDIVFGTWERQDKWPDRYGVAKEV
jgi:sterol desaturase/sphingolipid hydroxylase (fatty acid hydroxylase superfamily)